MFFRSDSYDFKSNTLKFLGVKDLSATKRIITSTIYSNLLRFNYVLSYSDLNQTLWSTSFDPKDPDNGWGFGYYKTIFPLKGKNQEIVPKGSIGYFLDNSCTYSNSSSHAYSNTFIGKGKVTEHEIVHATVYCLVSSDFNGDMVCLRADGTTFGDRVSRYDLASKDTWQMLSISASCNNGDAPVALYFNKQKVTDFSSLKGFVIFAYPQYQIISIEDTALSHDVLLHNSKNEKRLTGYNKTEFYDIKNGQLNKSSVFGLNNFRSIKISSYLGSLTFLSKTDTVSKDPDIFRNWIKNIIREDTSYYKNKSNLKVDAISKFFVDDRLSRWQFAFQIFSKEFNWKQKIFGGGFNFMNWYGYYFLKDKTKCDWPHNPFLSVLLYSGIVGLLFYLFLLYRVFFFYFKYLKQYPLLFIFFLITFYFSFFSGDSPYDPPIMGFFVILPFFIHSIQKKGNINSGQKQIDELELKDQGSDSI